jgi:hypothetical protein
VEQGEGERRRGLGMIYPGAPSLPLCLFAFSLSFFALFG